MVHIVADVQSFDRSLASVQKHQSDCFHIDTYTYVCLCFSLVIICRSVRLQDNQ
jgi:hypothetical protein